MSYSLRPILGFAPLAVRELPRLVGEGEAVWFHSGTFCQPFSVSKSGVIGPLDQLPVVGSGGISGVSPASVVSGWRRCDAPPGTSGVYTDAAFVCVGSDRPTGVGMDVEADQVTVLDPAPATLLLAAFFTGRGGSWFASAGGGGDFAADVINPANDEVIVVGGNVTAGTPKLVSIPAGLFVALRITPAAYPYTWEGFHNFGVSD